jgi:hypothetical protein
LSTLDNFGTRLIAGSSNHVVWDNGARTGLAYDRKRFPVSGKGSSILDLGRDIYRRQFLKLHGFRDRNTPSILVFMPLAPVLAEQASRIPSQRELQPFRRRLHGWLHSRVRLSIGSCFRCGKRRSVRRDQKKLDRR